MVFLPVLHCEAKFHKPACDDRLNIRVFIKDEPHGKNKNFLRSLTKNYPMPLEIPLTLLLTSPENFFVHLNILLIRQKLTSTSNLLAGLL